MTEVKVCSTLTSVGNVHAKIRNLKCKKEFKVLKHASYHLLRGARALHCAKKVRLITSSLHPFPQEQDQGSNNYDVVIVGGGMVGAAVGCGLANNPLTSSLRVAIVDGNSTIGTGQCMPRNAIPDPRVSAITPATASFLQGVGAWDYIKTCRLSPFNSMQVWDYTGLGYTRYNAADVDKPLLGYVVENNVLLSALHCHLQNSGFAEIICPARVKSVTLPARLPSLLESDLAEKNTQERIVINKTASASSSKGFKNEKEDSNVSLGAQGWARVELEDNQCLFSRLVVAADGARSKVRSMAGLQTLSWDYKQQAIICTVQMDREHSTAWQRFLPTGPLAILPMSETFSNVVWSTSPERALDLKTMSDEEFVAAVNKSLTEEYGPFPQSSLIQLVGDRFARIVGGVTPSVIEPFEVPPQVKKVVTERLSFPLSLIHAYKYISTRLALVGDAAHTVHPLAGQGVNLGFGDAASLVNVLSTGIEEGADIGEASLLRRYEKERMLANVSMMAVLDGFQKVFSADFGPLNLARAAAFKTVQLLGPLKKQVISYAMGGGWVQSTTGS